MTSRGRLETGMYSMQTWCLTSRRCGGALVPPLHDSSRIPRGQSGPRLARAICRDTAPRAPPAAARCCLCMAHSIVTNAAETLPHVVRLQPRGKSFCSAKR